MKLKSELTFKDRLSSGGQYVPCENPDCPNAYHYMEDLSFNVLQQDRPDDLIIDLSFCSLDCLMAVKDKFVELSADVNGLNCLN